MIPFLLCLAFLAGIFISSVITISLWQIFFIFTAGIFLLIFTWRTYPKIVLGLLCIAFGFGALRIFFAYSEIEQQQLLFAEIIGHQVEVTARVVKEPTPQGSQLRIFVKPEHLDAKVLVYAPRKDGIHYGDTISIRGTLQQPPQFADFSYRDFLLRQGVYAVLYTKEIQLQKQSANQGIFLAFWQQMEGIKNGLRTLILQRFPYPQDQMVAGLVLGDQDTLSQELRDQLNRSGVRHIMAISGMNIVILINIAMAFLLGIGLWRKHAIFLVLFLIGAYVTFTGLQPSAIRAGIMGSTFLIAQIMGRPGNDLRILLYAAVAMLVFQPLWLFDIGFLLSFFAVLGMIAFLPFLKKALCRVPSILGIKQTLATTLSAQAFTLPIMISNFGYFSLVSLVTNILVLPLMPFLLGFGALFLFVGSLFGTIGGFLLSLPLVWLLSYFFWVVDFFADIPFAVLQFSGTGLLIPIFIAVPLAFAAWKLRRRSEFLPYE